MWEDVSALLAEPARVEQEYRRRLEDSPAAEGAAAGGALAKRAAGLRKAISRLIDGSSEGLLEKEEFEPRLRAARERLRLAGCGPGARIRGTLDLGSERVGRNR